MRELPSDVLLGLLRRLAEGKNGVHIRGLIEALEEQGITGWSQSALRSHLESECGITVRTQLKVDGVNSMGIHHSDVPWSSESVVTVIPQPADSGETMRCIAPASERRACPERVVMLHPVPLCRFHRWQIAASLFSELADEESFRRSQVMALYDAAPPVRPTLDRPHTPVVYFLVLGNRVKIGYTANLGKRLAQLSLPRSAVALTLAGDRALELKLHAAFAYHRESKQSEWFRLEPPLSDYIKAKVTELAAAQFADEDAPVDVDRLPGGEPPEEPDAVAGDALLAEAERVSREAGYASVSLLQRRLGIGYARAGRLIDMLEAEGVIGPHQGSRPRQLLTPDAPADPEQVEIV